MEVADGDGVRAQRTVRVTIDIDRNIGRDGGDHGVRIGQGDASDLVGAHIGAGEAQSAHIGSGLGSQRFRGRAAHSRIRGGGEGEACREQRGGVGDAEGDRGAGTRDDGVGRGGGGYRPESSPVLGIKLVGIHVGGQHVGGVETIRHEEGPREGGTADQPVKTRCIGHAGQVDGVVRSEVHRASGHELSGVGLIGRNRQNTAVGERHTAHSIGISPHRKSGGSDRRADAEGGSCRKGVVGSERQGACIDRRGTRVDVVSGEGLGAPSNLRQGDTAVDASGIESGAVARSHGQGGGPAAVGDHAV